MKLISLLLTTLLLFLGARCFTQTKSWQNASEPLKFPVNNSMFTITTGYFNSYDTVVCQYKLKENDNIVFIGYKLVYKKDGYFGDDEKTFKVFFDERKKRIQEVATYVIL